MNQVATNRLESLKAFHNRARLELALNDNKVSKWFGVTGEELAALAWLIEEFEILHGQCMQLERAIHDLTKGE